MNSTDLDSCFATGGPDWLFPLLLGNGLAAVVCLVVVMGSAAPPATPARRNRPRRQLLLLAACVALSLVLGTPWLHLIALYVPMLAAGVVLRSADQPPTVASTGETIATHPGATPVVLGVLTGTLALGSLTAMILQGGPC